MPTYLTELQCCECGHTAPADSRANLCSECGASYLVQYDLAAAAKTLSKSDWAARPPRLWRYRELLPIVDPANELDLGEGGTPTTPLPTLAKSLGVEELWLKDEGLNPTGTFKDRGAATGAARAAELGETDLAMPTAGNAGSAWAAYCARAGLMLHVAMPADTPKVNMAECLAYGAQLYLVNGLISDAGALIGAACAAHGWYDVSTLKEPYRVEGKKTMGIEIAEQFDYQLPDVILYPTGGGVGLIGLWKAFNELEALGWIGSERPRLVSVQAEGCAPVVRAFEAGADSCEFFDNAATGAAGLRVPRPFADRLVMRILKETEGTAVAVSEQQIAAAVAELAACEGHYICPEGAAAVAALPLLRESGWLRSSDRVVILNTGTALKYVDAIDLTGVPVLDPGSALAPQA
ncbi:MAG: threonine synthase [Chloroflexota bacterium]|nr:threonine synthase [Chloroflexota bacterium]MDP6509213.1 threonine synthase [Chloroflexota bacterium]MDP6757643.1 threonine synthase [Chloroflexota bacterium]